MIFRIVHKDSAIKFIVILYYRIIYTYICEELCGTIQIQYRMETGTIGRDKSVVTGKYLKLATSKCGLYCRPTARLSTLVYLSRTVKHSLNYNHC